jgi:hypothetical protein
MIFDFFLGPPLPDSPPVLKVNPDPASSEAGGSGRTGGAPPLPESPPAQKVNPDPASSQAGGSGNTGGALEPPLLGDVDEIPSTKSDFTVLLINIYSDKLIEQVFKKWRDFNRLDKWTSMHREFVLNAYLALAFDDDLDVEMHKQLICS